MILNISYILVFSRMPKLYGQRKDGWFYEYACNIDMALYALKTVPSKGKQFKTIV